MRECVCARLAFFMRELFGLCFYVCVHCFCFCVSIVCVCVCCLFFVIVIDVVDVLKYFSMLFIRVLCH